VDTFCIYYMFFTCALVCSHNAHTTRVCTLHCTHARVQTFLDELSPNLLEHYTGHRKLHVLLDFVCAITCTRYAYACTHMRACVQSHIVRRIRCKFGGNIPMHGLHVLCLHYTHTMSMRALHACARSYIVGRILSGGTF
jgi:hypothetical protein